MTPILQYCIQNKTTGWKPMGRWATAKEAQAILTAQGLDPASFEVATVKGWHHDQKCQGCGKRETAYLEAGDILPRDCYECGGSLLTWHGGKWKVL